jgi:NADPH:quinone reductase-like Zn-dependent oxidoreductase
MPTIRDLKAAGAQSPGTGGTADSVAAAVKGHRQRFADLVFAEPYTKRFTEAYTKRFTDLVFTGVDTKRFADLLAAVQPTGGVLHEEASPTEPSVDWLLFAQLTLRALFATFMLIVMVAVWEEQKDADPALALLELIGAIWLWHEIDRAIWESCPNERLSC